MDICTGSVLDLSGTFDTDCDIVLTCLQHPVGETGVTLEVKIRLCRAPSSATRLLLVPNLACLKLSWVLEYCTAV